MVRQDQGIVPSDWSSALGNPAISHLLSQHTWASSVHPLHKCQRVFPAQELGKLITSVFPRQQGWFSRSSSPSFKIKVPEQIPWREGLGLRRGLYFLQQNRRHQHGSGVWRRASSTSPAPGEQQAGHRRCSLPLCWSPAEPLREEKAGESRIGVRGRQN